MGLARLSNELITDGYTMVDNTFILAYMPFAPENAVKVYLYGLSMARCNAKDNSEEGFAISLGITQQELKEAVEYWRDLGLMRIASENPLSIEYLPVSEGNCKIKKYKPEKYSSFNERLQALYQEKALTPNDYLRFIEVIEEYRIEQDAMLMIAAYCIKIRGEKIHINYILTVAKAWAREGATTVINVDKKLMEIEANSENMREIFYTLGLKSSPEIEDKQLYTKWTSSWGYDQESIVYAASLCKKRGGVKKLDSMLDSFYRLGIFSLQEIKEHAEYIKRTRELAIEVIRRLGLYYDNVDTVIEIYIAPWLEKGFEENAITATATYCFKKSIKTLDGMNAVMDGFYKQGLVTLESINDHIDKAIATDKSIKKLIELTGITRRVVEQDRKFYNTWVNIWCFNEDILKYAATLAENKTHSFAYMNNILAKWYKDGVTDVEQCKAMAAKSHPSSASGSKTIRFEGERDYSKEELDSILGEPNDIESLLRGL